MRRRIGAEEEFRVAGSGRGDERLAVHFALQHRQAVPVRANAPLEDGVAVIEQMVRGNRGCYGQRQLATNSAASFVVMCSMTTFSRRKALESRAAAPVDKHFFAVEKIDFRIGDLAMHQQRQADALHLGQRVVGLFDGGQAGIGIGRCPRRVKFDRLDKTGSGGLTTSLAGVLSVR
jgi:hypothetical protein